MRLEIAAASGFRQSYECPGIAPESEILGLTRLVVDARPCDIDGFAVPFGNGFEIPGTRRGRRNIGLKYASIIGAGFEIGRP